MDALSWFLNILLYVCGIMSGVVLFEVHGLFTKHKKQPKTLFKI
jgi:hypothetical protein